MDKRRGRTVSLEMRPECERCNAVLEDGGTAFICSYECTFCAGCAAIMNHIYPNCGSGNWWHGPTVCLKKRNTALVISERSVS